MENTYLIIMIVVLFALAISDLVVGVANDAVNFLNSAIGSKVASRTIIMGVATLGILIGASFSGGMMEVARNSIFNPQLFTFSSIMVIFLAVMITDVILLDLFNTFGMPTSTTVSIVFELLGAAVAVSLLIVAKNPELSISSYINTATVLGIITGILMSVGISFTFGAIIMFLVRLAFSFNYTKRLAYLGSIWGSIAITSIIYFLLIKGAKGATFIDDQTQDWIKHNGFTIVAYSFVAWAILLQALRMLFKINVLKIVVLAGTFALAMAFASNDLVNFIGVPLAGFESYKLLISTPGATPDTLLMTGLAGKVGTPTFMLIIAGIIMGITLWTSKKAATVTKTEIDLSRQIEGDERFGSSLFARSLVRTSLNISNAIDKILPEKVKKYISLQFNSEEADNERKKLGKDAPTFDLLRASVNLLVSSLLISMATNMKLPLSTTYVTFMVAMGTSLSDKAWGRESAVYRITGVLSVIGGWFFTAFFAFCVAFVMALMISWGGAWALIALIGLAIYTVYRTQILHTKRSAEESEIRAFDIEEVNGEISTIHVMENCKLNVTETLTKVTDLYIQALNSFEAEDRKGLKDANKEVAALNKQTKKLKNNIYPTVKKLQEQAIDSSLYYVQVIDYLRETTHCLSYITDPSFNHIDNNHKVFTPEQFEDLNLVKVKVKATIDKSIKIISKGDFVEINELMTLQQEVLDLLKTSRKKQLKRIKNEKAGTKNSLLYLNILHETQNLLLHLINIVKSQRDFLDYHKE